MKKPMWCRSADKESVVLNAPFYKIHGSSLLFRCFIIRPIHPALWTGLLGPLISCSVSLDHFMLPIGNSMPLYPPIFYIYKMILIRASKSFTLVIPPTHSLRASSHIILFTFRPVPLPWTWREQFLYYFSKHLPGHTTPYWGDCQLFCYCLYFPLHLLGPVRQSTPYSHR
jgi:hypothetical protein